MVNQDENRKVRGVGFECPVCGAFIETSIPELLYSSALECRTCRLRISVDRTRSKEAMTALEKVRRIQEQIDRKGGGG